MSVQGDKVEVPLVNADLAVDTFDLQYQVAAGQLPRYKDHVIHHYHTISLVLGYVVGNDRGGVDIRTHNVVALVARCPHMPREPINFVHLVAVLGRGGGGGGGGEGLNKCARPQTHADTYTRMQTHKHKTPHIYSTRRVRENTSESRGGGSHLVMLL